MQNVFYKIKCKDFIGNNIEKIHTNINEIKKDFNTLNETSGISDIKIFIVNEIEEELSIDQLPD